jgi:tRNA-intron endonuclease
LIDVRGKTGEHAFSKATGILMENRVIIFDKKLGDSLLEKEFFGKPFGTGLQLSLAEALYLMEKDAIDIQNIDGKKLSLNKFKTFIQQSQPDIESRITVFRDLKKRGLIVKTGFKFGAHFRAYTKNPNETHAEYLIHVVNKGFRSIWAEISRAVRLAHSVNKEILFARVDDGKVNYIKFGRLRP